MYFWLFGLFDTWNNGLSFVDCRNEAAVDNGVHDGYGGDLLAHEGGHEVSDLTALGDAADADAFRGINVVP